MWSLRVVIASIGVGRDLTWWASSNRWPGLRSLNELGAIKVEENGIRAVDLNLGSIKMMWSLGVVIACVGIGRDLTWWASSNGWPLLRSLNELGAIKIEENGIRAVDLNPSSRISSIKVMWSLRVVITWG
jgi:hypothetical protein